MFEKIIKELARLERGVQVEVKLPSDERGYFDRRCPARVCGEHFKVLLEDWQTKGTGEARFCPVCGHAAPLTEWNTKAQMKHIKELGLAHLSKVLGTAMGDDARKFKSHASRSSFMRMTLEVRPGSRPVVLPVAATDVMEVRSTCEQCGCGYASIGAAFFCPACGHNSAGSMFAAVVSSVRTTIDRLDEIERAWVERLGKDAARDARRHLLETSLQRLIASFQRMAEATFAKRPNAAQFKVRKNLFQNLSESSDLWFRAAGMRYEDLLPPADFSELVRLFQQRHLLAHREGLVDQDYVDRSGDRTYSVGQRVVIRERDVLRLVELVDALAKALT